MKRNLIIQGTTQQILFKILEDNSIELLTTS